MTGLATLLRLHLRRDRMPSILWAALMALMAMGSATRYRQLFGEDDARESFARAVEDNRVLGAFGGQLFTHQLGGLVHFKIGSTLYTLIALCALLTVIRHTRDDEENGRLELYRAGAVHPSAPLLAGWLTAISTVAFASIVSVTSLILAKLPIDGVFAFGLAMFGQGVLFASLAAVAAQLTASSRSARLIAGLILGISYTLRFFSDGAAMARLHWFSFEGWAHEVRPFADNRLRVALLPIAVSALLLPLAVILDRRRDLGEGLIAARPGNARGGRLGSVLALAWRLHRGTLLAWCAGFAVLGILLGNLKKTFPELVDRAGPIASEFFRRYSTPEGSLADAFVWLVIASLGYVLSIFAVLSVLRLRQEELNGNAELLLSAPLSRTRWAMSHLIVSCAGTALVLLVTGIAFAIGIGDRAEIFRTIGAALALIPAMWTMTGFAMAAFGILPRWSIAIGWVAVLYVNTFGEIVGPALGVEWDVADRFVPFHWVPNVLAGQFSIVPLIALTAVAAALSAAGLARLRMRDTQPG